MDNIPSYSNLNKNLRFKREKNLHIDKITFSNFQAGDRKTTTCYPK